MGTASTIGTIIVGIIALVIIIGIVVFMIKILAPLFIGLVVLVILVGVVTYVYTRLKVK
jgi:hypothetical protein